MPWNYILAVETKKLDTGINLEDIKAPERFRIGENAQEMEGTL